MKNIRFRVAVVAVTAMLAGCASPTGDTTSNAPVAARPTVAAQLAAHGVEAPIETIPWPQVGPGWMLALWSPAVGHRPGEEPGPNEPTWDKVNTTLYLVNPGGGRYPITVFPTGSTVRLVDWSGDKTHALFVARASDSGPGKIVIAIDLRTGKQTTFPVAKDNVIGYARPDGTAVLTGERYQRDRPGSLVRIDLTGKPELTYPVGPDYRGGALPTLDGAYVVLATTKGLAVLGIDGIGRKDLPVPGALTACSPVRWWTSTVVLASCKESANHSTGAQLWQVPIDGAAPSALTAVNSGQGTDPGFEGDYGDIDAWQLTSGTFLQSLGPCGTVFLSRLTSDGHTTRVDVPGVSNSVYVYGVSDDKLVLLAKKGCGDGTSLLTYDPVANNYTVVLGPTVNGGSVSEAIVYPGRG